MKNNKKIVEVLSIAGSDSSGGAGIQADLKTITSLGGYCVTAITCVTAQNKKEILNIESIDCEILRNQIISLKKDFKIDSIKIGLLTSDICSKVVLDTLKDFNKTPIVVDPVYISSSGFKFINQDSFIKSQSYLTEIATLLTPNICEAEILSGISPINNKHQMFEGIKKIFEKFKVPTLLTGGDLDNGMEVIDILFDGKNFFKFSCDRIKIKSSHGTGCIFSSAISYYLGFGLSIKKSIEKAKVYISKVLKRSSEQKKFSYLKH